MRPTAEIVPPWREPREKKKSWCVGDTCYRTEIVGTTVHITYIRLPDRLFAALQGRGGDDAISSPEEVLRCPACPSPSELMARVACFSGQPGVLWRSWAGRGCSRFCMPWERDKGFCSALMNVLLGCWLAGRTAECAAAASVCWASDCDARHKV